jgi:hypothetical protein
MNISSFKILMLFQSLYFLLLYFQVLHSCWPCPTASAFMNVTFTNGSSGIMENQTIIPEQGTLLILAAKQIMANNEELRDLLLAAADEEAEDLSPEESSDEVGGSNDGGDGSGNDGGGDISDGDQQDPSNLICYHKENITA